MKKNEKRMILILVAITLVVIVIFVATRKGDKTPVVDNGQQQNVQNTVVEEFVDVQQDGTKVNTSNKLAETKTVDGLEISNISLTEKNNESYIRATVKNTTSETKGDEFITLTVIDKEGNTLTEVKGYLDTIQPGATATLSIRASADFANAYDFKVSK